MGLCKCPRKKVTSLFCFEHRVNVCEHCLMQQHAHCVVQSYLMWLQDSDYDPKCILCTQPFGDAQCVRLTCLHLYHWDCLNTWAQAHPANTAPAGYKCPSSECNAAVFPPPNQTSPIVDALKQTMANANWARAGIGLPLLPELERVLPKLALMSSSTNDPTPNGNIQQTVVHVDQSEGMNARKVGPSQSDIVHNLLSSPHTNNDADDETQKYKRRPASEWLSRFLKSRGVRAADPLRSYKRIFLIIVFILIALITLITILTRVTQTSDDPDGDPFLDPMANPNVRVAREESVP